MELPVLFQAEQFAQALLLGGLLGLVYDLLRAPRRFLPKLGTMLDALFLLLLFLSLLGFALYVGQIFSRAEPGCSAGFDRASPVFWAVFAYDLAAGTVLRKKIFSFFEKPLCKKQKMGYNYR